MQIMLRRTFGQWATRKRLKKAFVIVMLICCSPALPAFLAMAQAPTDPRAAQQDSERTAAIILAKNTLLAVNQGNLTGNYTVLRDLASPAFRERNSAADLATIFQNIRRQKIDLSPIVVLDPVMSPPRVGADGQITLEGYFATQQIRINFQLVYLKANSNGWMIHGVSLNAVPDNTAAASADRR